MCRTELLLSSGRISIIFFYYAIGEQIEHRTLEIKKKTYFVENQASIESYSDIFFTTRSSSLKYQTLFHNDNLFIFLAQK